nr:MAG TPA: hypothetical protein [Caudoviricetes sp.]
MLNLPILLLLNPSRLKFVFHVLLLVLQSNISP